MPENDSIIERIRQIFFYLILSLNKRSTFLLSSKNMYNSNILSILPTAIDVYYDWKVQATSHRHILAKFGINTTWNYHDRSKEQNDTHNV